MKWLDSSGGSLRVISKPCARGDEARGVSAFGRMLAARAVHEILYHPFAHTPSPVSLVYRIFHRVVTESDRPVTGVWCDPDHTLYPPALAAGSVPLDRLYVIRAPADQIVWAATECLRCPGVGVVVGLLPSRMSRVQVRRLQLAAERGGGMGLMLRPVGAGDHVYAAATRWWVAPMPGDRHVQKWRVRLLHGQGGPQSFVLEDRRDTDRDFGPAPLPVRPPAPVVDHPVVAQIRKTGT